MSFIIEWFRHFRKRRREKEEFTKLRSGPVVSGVKIITSSTVAPRDVREPEVRKIKLPPDKELQWQALKNKYDNLMRERAEMREKLNEIDRKSAIGEISQMERDRIWRQILVKLSEIATLQEEIKAKCAELGRPLY
ncbi:MAG: hypothetical protein ACTSSJ_07535 [Candidatus Odinarchaeia archaeon]